jgi:transcriptional regulator with XRE-family HTH domain
MPDSIDERQNLSTVNRPGTTSPNVAMWQHAGMTFGGRLREARKARGLTAIELGELAGVSNSGISRWEQGKRAPGGAYAQKLAKALGVTERWLMSGEGPREPGPVALETPVGMSALEAVLFSYEWPDVPIDLVDELTEALRAEAVTNGGRHRPASAWRLRVGQLLRERTPKRRTSRPRMRAITGGSR